jgi:putrescine transport system permease protein
VAKVEKMKKIILIFGLAFLYIPIFILCFYSFNESKLVTVWGGFSTKWYFELFKNARMMEAAATSFKLAFLSASFATLLGLCASYTLTKYGNFKGKTLYLGLLSAPLVLPEVILALSLLLLFVAFDISRGFTTTLIAHTTFTLCFVIVILMSRFQSLDWSQEEAARDLGATPASAFRKVVLPQLLPHIIASWLLAFTLSLDDLIIASFTAGAGTTTLPMRIYSQARLGITPEINALSTLILGVITITVATAMKLINNNNDK